jgi:hypothetical protein
MFVFFLWMMARWALYCESERVQCSSLEYLRSGISLRLLVVEANLERALWRPRVMAREV